MPNFNITPLSVSGQSPEGKASCADTVFHVGLLASPIRLEGFSGRLTALFLTFPAWPELAAVPSQGFEASGGSAERVIREFWFCDIGHLSWNRFSGRIQLQRPRRFSYKHLKLLTCPTSPCCLCSDKPTSISGIHSPVRGGYSF